MSRPAALRGCPCTVCLPQGCGPGMPGPYAKRPPFDKGGQTVEKGVLTPWPPLRGGSARRRWGRELYGCPKYFGLWQGSLPPPLRGTAPPLAQAPPPPYRGVCLAEGGFFDTLGFPLGGSCQRPRPLTDEGEVFGAVPQTASRRTLAPHPACGHLPPRGKAPKRAAFPRRGRLLRMIKRGSPN